MYSYVMNPKIRSITFLTLVLLISLLVRVYQLGLVPNGLTVDEADMGYSAYSILTTGKDIYGRSYPLFFQSLDDYKAGFGIYAALPSVGLFGLNDSSIRLVPAILGSLIPVLIFFLVKHLYPKSRYLAFLSAILTCFAPWNIAISRANLPYIELIFFYLLFLITFFYSLNKHKFRPLSFMILGFTLYVYYAAVVYLPLILVIIFLIYRKDLFSSFKVTAISILLLTVVSGPAILHYFNSTSRTRLNAISVLTPDVTLPLSIAEIEDDQKSGYPLASIIHNRRYVYANAMLNNYFDYFNLDYLFVNSHNIRYFYVNYVGLFYLIELPFFFFGLWGILKKRDKSDLLILSLLIISPIPAIITLGSPFVHRGILLLLAIQLISSIGVVSFFELVKVKKSRYRLHFMGMFGVIYALNVFFFLHQYFIHSPSEFTSENDNGAWFSTVRDVIPKVNELKNHYDKVVFTWAQPKLVPGVYYLFYNKVDPKILQKKAALWTNEPPSYRQIYNEIENVEFRPIYWDTDKQLKNTLFVGYPKEFPQDFKVIDKTYLPNGGTHFIFVETE